MMTRARVQELLDDNYDVTVKYTNGNVTIEAITTGPVKDGMNVIYLGIGETDEAAFSEMYQQYNTDKLGTEHEEHF